MTPAERAAMLAEVDMFIGLCNRAIDGDEQAKAELQVLAAANIAVMTEQARQRAWGMIRERDWDETPREAARADDQWWDIDRDYDTEPDED